jgi:hypothetical protein
MADIKSVFIEVPSLEADSGPGCREVLAKGAVFSNYSPGQWPPNALEPLTIKGSLTGSLAEALNNLQSGRELTVLKLESQNFDGDLFELLDNSDRRTILAVTAPDKLAFYGFGVNQGSFAAAASFSDIWPTLASVGEFYLTSDVSGAVLFEALKNPNFKQTQIAKLKAALARLEKMLKRDNQEPWDKHDCA